MFSTVAYNGFDVDVHRMSMMILLFTIMLWLFGVST